MAKSIAIIIKAKNQLASGLEKARSSIVDFSQGVIMAGKKMAAAFIGAGTALAGTMYKAAEFNKQIGQITTVSDLSMGQARSEVRKLSVEFGLAKEELTKGLYDALSAGVPQENVFEFMRVASKAAIAGATTTAQSVDFLTTAINAFKIPVGDADKVADALFQTVKIGKTTVEELSSSFAVVGPIASASGVSFQQVLAATAELTKQGTSTSQAMTQIRSAIIAMNEVLGDGWSRTMTLQEGMVAMAEKANYSNTELKDLTGRVEAVTGILGLTGENARGAAESLDQVTDSAGAASEAFNKMKDTSTLDKFKASVGNLLLVIGDRALEALGPYIETWTTNISAFAEKIDEFSKRGGLADLIAQVQIFALEFGKGFELAVNSALVAWASLKDGFNTVITYISDLVGVMIGNTISKFTQMGESLKYIATSIIKPWTFSMDELRSMFERHYENSKQMDEAFVRALKGNQGIITENADKALADRLKIEERYARLMLSVNEDHARSLAELHARNSTTIYQTKAASIGQINQAVKAGADKEKADAQEVVEVVEEAEDKKKEAVKETKDTAKALSQEAKDKTKADKTEEADHFVKQEERKREAIRITSSAASSASSGWANTGFNEGVTGGSFAAIMPSSKVTAPLIEIPWQDPAPNQAEIVSILKDIREQNASLLTWS